jgi:hypothetical protein
MAGRSWELVVKKRRFSWLLMDWKTGYNEKQYGGKQISREEGSRSGDFQSGLG